MKNNKQRDYKIKKEKPKYMCKEVKKIAMKIICFSSLFSPPKEQIKTYKNNCMIPEA